MKQGLIRKLIISMAALGLATVALAQPPGPPAGASREATHFLGQIFGEAAPQGKIGTDAAQGIRGPRRS